MKRINKILWPLLIIPLVLNLMSCKDVVKKVAKETSIKSVKHGALTTAKDVGGHSLQDLGEKTLKELRWKEVILALEKDNPLLGRGLKKLSRTFRKELANGIQTDYRLYQIVLMSPSIMDDYQRFVNHEIKLCNDPDCFKWFAHTEYNAKEKGINNFLNRLEIKDGGEQFVIYEKNSIRQIAEIRDGVVSITNAFGDEGNHIIPAESILRNELRPNSVYKLRDGSGVQFNYNVDDLGRISSVRLNKVSSDEITTNVLELNPEVNLGAEGEEILSRISNYSNDEPINLSIRYTYTDNSFTPAYVRFEEIGDKQRISATIANKSGEELGVNAIIRRTSPEVIIVNHFEGDDALRYCSDNNNKVYDLLNSIMDYPGTTSDKFILNVYDDGTVRISHKDWTVSSMEIKGNRVRVKAGSIADAQDQSLNQFFNTRMPQTTYEIDEYMEITTDDLARVSETRATFTRENLVKRSGQRDSHTQSRIVREQDGIDGDEGGHLIQRALGGGNEYGNQVPMAYDVNHNVFASIERAEMESVENGSVVRPNRKCIYDGNSKRPSSFIIDDVVDDQPMKVIINGKEYVCPIKVSNTSPALIQQM